MTCKECFYLKEGITIKKMEHKEVESIEIVYLCNYLKKFKEDTTNICQQFKKKGANNGTI